MSEALQEQVERLERKLRQTQRTFAAAALALVAAIAAVALIPRSVAHPEIIRARGLVISDATGKERVLIGAPVPETASRKRSGAETTSLVFLDADGHDRVIVGQAPEPYVGGVAHERIGEAHGLTFYDPNGSERGGIAYLDSGRAVVALDYPERDAIGMMVDDKNGFAGMLIAHKPPAESAAILMGVQDGKPSLSFSDPQARERARLEVEDEGAPGWRMKTASGATE